MTYDKDEVLKVLVETDELFEEHLIKPTEQTLRYMARCMAGKETMYTVGRQHFHWLSNWAMENDIVPQPTDINLHSCYIAYVYCRLNGISF